jgi:hypothetical protein
MRRIIGILSALGNTLEFSKMGKSFASVKRQVTETRRRSKKRDGGEVGRVKREALYAHMRAGGKSNDVEGDIQDEVNGSKWEVEDLDDNEDSPVQDRCVLV